jgi:hypothetical protein
MRNWVFAVLLVGCGGNQSGDDDGPGDRCDAGVECPDGQFCSTTGVCMPDGACGSGDDCGAGTFCSANQTCITDGSCAADADCGGGMQCGSDGTCSIGGCGGQFLNLTYTPPNMLLVVDRSCSMNNKLSGTNTTKWEAAVASIQTVIADYADDVQWGLTLFPDTTGQSCAQDGNLPFPVGPGNAANIDTMLTAALDVADPFFPDGPCVTNIDTGIQQAALDPGLSDPARKSFLMLVSDGAQSGCSLGGSDTGTEAAIADLFTNRGIPTFVVGFGSGTDSAELDKLATNGGTALAATPKYYQADNAAQLDQAFQSIAELVVSCEFTVDPAPADLAQTYVFYDKTELVPHDPAHGDGWDYDPATMKLTLYGGYCDRLKAHDVADVDVVFGCPTPPVL